MEQTEELKKEQLEDIFQIYQSKLAWINRRLEPDTLKFYKEDAKTWEHAKEAVFTMYEAIRSSLGPVPHLSDCLKTEKKEGIPPYKMKGSKSEFPCIGILEYRGYEYPVYDDDYGMDSFVIVEGHCITVDSFCGETDWYYELDRIIDKIDIN